MIYSPASFPHDDLATNNFVGRLSPDHCRPALTHAFIFNTDIQTAKPLPDHSWLKDLNQTLAVAPAHILKICALTMAVACGLGLL